MTPLSILNTDASVVKKEEHEKRNECHFLKNHLSHFIPEASVLNNV